MPLSISYILNLKINRRLFKRITNSGNKFDKNVHIKKNKIHLRGTMINNKHYFPVDKYIYIICNLN